MLPAALDPSLVARAADGLWDILGEHMPRLERHDSSTWTTFVGEEQILRRMDQGKSHAGGDVLFECKGSRFSTRNGAEQSMLDCLPRQLWSLAEQMMGAGEVTWPAGVDERGEMRGPCFMDAGASGSMRTHMDVEDWPVSGRTEELALPRTGPGWLNVSLHREHLLHSLFSGSDDRFTCRARARRACTRRCRTASDLGGTRTSAVARGRGRAATAVSVSLPSLHAHLAQADRRSNAQMG